MYEYKKEQWAYLIFILWFTGEAIKYFPHWYQLYFRYICINIKQYTYYPFYCLSVITKIVVSPVVVYILTVFLKILIYINVFPSTKNKISFPVLLSFYLTVECVILHSSSQNIPRTIVKKRKVYDTIKHVKFTFIGNFAFVFFYC